MNKRTVVIPKYTKLPNGGLMATGYRAYTVISNDNGKVIRTQLKKEK